MGHRRGRFVRTSALTLAFGMCVVLERSAVAAPPPPSFWNFTISNTSGQDVVDVVVLMYPHVSGQYHQINTSTPVRLEVSSLAQGSTVKLGIPTVYGIAKIDASAKCPAPQTASVSITATQSDFIPGGSLEYAGFSPQSPTSPNGDYVPTLEFYAQGGQAKARLHAKSRWDASWDAQPKMDDKAFQ